MPHVLTLIPVVWIGYALMYFFKFKYETPAPTLSGIILCLGIISLLIVLINYIGDGIIYLKNRNKK